MHYELQIRREMAKLILKGLSFNDGLRTAWADQFLRKRHFVIPLAVGPRHLFGIKAEVSLAEGPRSGGDRVVSLVVGPRAGGHREWPGQVHPPGREGPEQIQQQRSGQGLRRQGRQGMVLSHPGRSRHLLRRQQQG